MTNYYMIPNNDLPLVDPIRAIPIIGNPIADLLKPDLTYLVNLGYGNPLYGWSTSPANIDTPFGLFPPLSSFQELPGLLASGAGQGIQNFIGDFTGTGPNPVTLPSLSSITSLLDPSSGTGVVTSPMGNSLSALQAFSSDPAATLATLITDAANSISTGASSYYSVLLPTADYINAAVITIPAYDASLFLNNLSNPIERDRLADRGRHGTVRDADRSRRLRCFLPCYESNSSSVSTAMVGHLIPTADEAARRSATLASSITA